jgi:hypothetical protein
VRVAYHLKDAPDDPRFVIYEYYLAVPDGEVSAYCSGDEPPADRWLSIIEAIAPLLAELPTSAPFDSRVEVPEHGLAVDFPADWLVRGWAGPGPVLGGAAEPDTPPSEMSMAMLRAVTAEGGPTSAECIVEDASRVPGLPEVASLDDWRDTLVSIAGAQGTTD